MEKNFMLQGATKLSKSEMKSVKGGAMSSMCADGESLYRCSVSYGGGGSFSGVVCGRDAGHAAAAVFVVHGEPGTEIRCTGRS